MPRRPYRVLEVRRTLVVPCAVTPKTMALHDWLRKRADVEDGRRHRRAFKFKSYEAFVDEYGRP